MKTALKAISLSALAILSLSPLSAFASEIGIVDLDKVVASFDKAQALMSDIKVKEAELRKMQADYVKQLEDAKKSQQGKPVSVDAMEKDLNGKLNAKLTEYRDWTTTKQKEVDSALDNTIKEVAKAKNIDVVLSKQAVFQGGTDITTDVITRLNTSATK